MSTEQIDTTEAAGILGVRTHRAALAIIKEAGLSIEYGRYKNAYVNRDSVAHLAEVRKARGVKRGRPKNNSLASMK